MNECRLVTGLFQTLNNTVKAVVDNVFIENKDTQIKEKALLQLFTNQGNMCECFKRWREANKIAKIDEAMSNKEKAALLKMLEGVLKSETVARFR